jgi:molecular chaperone IbpA
MFRSTITFNQLKPLSIGLNDFFNFAESFPFDVDEPVFPKYNIIKPTDTTWIVELALAGYSKQDIDIEHKDGVLTISHKKLKATELSDKPKIIHQGITKKAFSKSFAVAESVVVNKATFIDGLLSIHLEDIVPEDKKSKKIQIS